MSNVINIKACEIFETHICHMYYIQYRCDIHAPKLAPYPPRLAQAPSRLLELTRIRDKPKSLLPMLLLSPPSLKSHTNHTLGAPSSALCIWRAPAPNEADAALPGAFTALRSFAAFIGTPEGEHDTSHPAPSS